MENRIFCFPHHCGDLKEFPVISRTFEAHAVGLITKISLGLSFEFCQRYVIFQTICAPSRDATAIVPEQTPESTPCTWLTVT